MAEIAVGRVAVIGAGTMGTGIVQTFARTGIPAVLVDSAEAALDRARRQIASDLALCAEFGLLDAPAERVQERIELVASTAIAVAVEGCDVVIESIPEILDAKRQLFLALDHLPRSTLIATNTSSFTVSELTAGMCTASRVVGLHYFNPAHIMPAVEIHRGAATEGFALDRARAVMIATGKVPISVKKEIAGFVINRLTGALEREIDHLLDEGIVSPNDLDAAVKASIGFRLACLGPMEAEDMIGLDIAAIVSANLYPKLSARTTPSPELLAKVRRGDLGVKSGRGWYDYSDRSRDAVLQERNRKLLRQLQSSAPSR